MIKYNHGGAHFLLNICRLRGSVFPRAVSVAGPAAVICVLIVMFQDEGEIFDVVGKEESVTRDNAVWSGFSFLVGFLIVFRTSQSYNRFWDGCTSTHQMRAEWFDGCSSLLAFCRHSKAGDNVITAFQNTLVRLFSMLHSAALAEIEDSSSPDIDDVKSFRFELVDVQAIDAESLKAVKECEAKVELIFQWIQQLIVENINTGVLSIPPPILSRSFQEIANGMVAFHDAMKISQIPFPFPYAQTCDFLLWLHWLVVPFVVSQWCKEPLWAAIFSFIQVFILWVLNFIAVELENPFGCDANDIDGFEMQSEMNQLLMLLMSPACKRTPHLMPNTQDLSGMNMDRKSGLPTAHRACGKSFYQVWADIDEEEGIRASAVAPPRHRISVVQLREAEVEGRRNSYLSWQSSRGNSTSIRSMATATLSVGKMSSMAPSNSWQTSTISSVHSPSTLAVVAENGGSQLNDSQPSQSRLSSTSQELLSSPLPTVAREYSDGMPDEPVTTSLPRVVIEARLPTHGMPSDHQWRDANTNLIPGGSMYTPSGQIQGILSKPGNDSTLAPSNDYLKSAVFTDTKHQRAFPRDSGRSQDTSLASHPPREDSQPLSETDRGSDHSVNVGAGRRVIKFQNLSSDK